jgi:hypothetical protein
MATGQAEIYTADKGQPPMDDEGPTKQMPPKPKKRVGQTEVYTADMGNPPMDYEGPTTPAKPKKGKPKFAAGGSVSSRADGCAQRGKTKGRFV